MAEASNQSAVTKFGAVELCIFLIAIASGTACSICSKTMMELHGPGIDGDDEVFEKPLFQTFGMFVGMMFGLIMHWVVLVFKIPFPGYEYSQKSGSNNSTTDTSTTYGSIEENKKLITTVGEAAPLETPAWMYWFLVIPSIFDVGATALCMLGLRFLDVSLYQLLRGSGIIFVALMKQHVLKHRLYNFQWIGVIWNVVAVVLVGLTAVLASGADESRDSGEALLGVLLVLTGAFVQALQFVFEEKVMTMDDALVPPLLLIGMEGLWGTVICLFLLYPLAYCLPGDDHGSFEDPFNTYAMFMNSTAIQWSFVIYFFVIFSYNLFAILVTFMLNSIWHAILDNFRPITIWIADLAIYYMITSGSFGEPWTKYSVIQLFGMLVLLFGTAVYNAPNAGSIKLLGQWYAFGMNFSQDYTQVEAEMEEEELDREWQERQKNFKNKRASSLAQKSPYMSVHTQALHGLAASHN